MATGCAATKTKTPQHNVGKNNDKYGFIAQELQMHLPKELNHIVQDIEDKHSDDKFLSINYMKPSYP